MEYTKGAGAGGAAVAATNGNGSATAKPIPSYCLKVMASVPAAGAKCHETVVSGWLSESGTHSDEGGKFVYFNNSMWLGSRRRALLLLAAADASIHTYDLHPFREVGNAFLLSGCSEGIVSDRTSFIG